MVTRRELAATVGMRGALGSLGVAGAGWLAGCAGQGGPSQQGAGGPDTGPARVTVLFPGGATDAEDYKAVGDAMTQKYPKIDAAWTVNGSGQAYNDKLGSLFAAGDGPDVFKSQIFTFGQFASSGAYRALDDYVKRDAAQVQLDDFFPAHVGAVKFKGKFYALPNDGAPQALWVNVDLWRREGLTPLTWDSTWADLLKAATALTRRESSNQEATQLGIGRPEWLTWVWSAGGDLWSADGTRLLFDQQPVIDALTWLQDAVNKQRVAPDPTEQSDPALPKFENGSVAAVTGNRGVLGTYRSIDGFTYDVVPVPKGPRGRVSRLGVGYTSIWSGSKVPDPAFTVVNYICSAEAQRVKISRGFAHPSRKSSVAEDWFKDYKTPRSASTGINTVFADTLKRDEARSVTPHPKEADINTVIENNLGALWSGTKSPREIVQAVAAEASQFLVK
jgi:multiple sugar transport system substrate-binding protein